MSLSGWTRLWIVAGALGLAGCGGGTTAEDAFSQADAALGEVDQLRDDLRRATDQIDDLEDRIVDLENAKIDLEIELGRVARQASNAEGAALSRR